MGAIPKQKALDRIGSIRRALAGARIMQRGAETAKFLRYGARVWLPQHRGPAVSLVAVIAMTFATTGIAYQVGWSQGRLTAARAARAVDTQSDPSPEADTSKETRLADASTGGRNINLNINLSPAARTAFARANLPDPISNKAVVQTILEGSSHAGMDPVYMVSLASKESGFDKYAAASSSTARGLYQFTDQTWLRVVAKFGPDYGLGKLSDAITDRGNGHLTVQDGETRRTILALRDDPYLSTVMAAELAKADKSRLEELIGRRIETAEMYFTHLLGLSVATDFFNALDKNPNVKVSRLSPKAARANRSLFRKRDGTERTVREFYQFIKSSMERRVDYYRPVIVQTENKDSLQFALVDPDALSSGTHVLKR